MPYECTLELCRISMGFTVLPEKTGQSSQQVQTWPGAERKKLFNAPTYYPGVINGCYLGLLHSHPVFTLFNESSFALSCFYALLDSSVLNVIENILLCACNSSKSFVINILDLPACAIYVHGGSNRADLCLIGWYALNHRLNGWAIEFEYMNTSINCDLS